MSGDAGCDPESESTDIHDIIIDAGGEDSELKQRPMLALLMQLGYILSLNRCEKYHRDAARLRITRVVFDANEARCKTFEASLARACDEARVLNADVEVISLETSGGEHTQRPLLGRIRHQVMQGIGGEATTAAVRDPAPLRRATSTCSSCTTRTRSWDVFRLRQPGLPRAGKGQGVPRLGR